MKYIFILFFFFIPLSSLGATITPDCTYWDTRTMSCTGSTLTSGGSSQYAIHGSDDNFFNPNTLYYITFTTDGTGTGKVFIRDIGIIDNEVQFTDGGDKTININTNGYSSSITMGFQSDTDYAGNISDICVSDVSYDECTGGGGGGALSPDCGWLGRNASGTIECMATTTAVMQQMLISQLGFQAILLFIIALILGIWTWRSFMP